MVPATSCIAWVPLSRETTSRARYPAKRTAAMAAVWGVTLLEGAAPGPRSPPPPPPPPPAVPARGAGPGRRPYTPRLVSKRPLGCLFEVVETLVLTVIIFLVIQNFVAQPYRIEQ